MADDTLSVDLNAPLRRLGRDLSATLECALLSVHGLRALGAAPTNLSTDSTPADIAIALEIPARTIDRSRPDAERWIFANAFREAIEHVAAFFEGLREADAFLSLISTSRTFTHDAYAHAVSEPAGASIGSCSRTRSLLSSAPDWSHPKIRHG